MQPAHHGACTQLASPLSHLQREPIQPAAVAAIHPFAESAVVGVAVVVRVVGGVGVACGFLVSAVHSFIPFRWFNYSTEIVTSQYIFLLQFCYGRPAKILAGAKKGGCLVSRHSVYPVVGLSAFLMQKVANLCAHHTNLGVPSAPPAAATHLYPAQYDFGTRWEVDRVLRTLMGRTPPYGRCVGFAPLPCPAVSLARPLRGVVDEVALWRCLPPAIPRWRLPVASLSLYRPCRPSRPVRFGFGSPLESSPFDGLIVSHLGGFVKGFPKFFSFSRLSTWPSWFSVLPLQHHRESFGERRSFLPAQV